MSKPLPIWQELPTHFKEDVVGYLDFKSRLNLRSCSKSELNLIDSCPLHIHSLQIFQEEDDPLHFFLTFGNNEPRYKFGSEEHNASALFNLFSHRNSKCTFLVFYCELEYSLDKLILKFIGKLKNRDQKLDVDIFDWGSGKSAVLIQMLRFLKSDVLNKIRLNLMDFEEETGKSIVRELVETDQFKSAHRIHLYNCSVDDYFEKFLRFDNLIKIGVEKLTEEMLLKLMDAAKTRNPPIGSQFVVRSNELIELDTLRLAFENFEGVRTSLKQDQTPQKAVHLISDTRRLVIIKWNKAVEATVCGRKNWQDDFKKYHGDHIHVDSI
ncbi:unnamed protein product [Caenorhabditis brenneri]